MEGRKEGSIKEGKKEGRVNGWKKETQINHRDTISFFIVAIY